MLQNRFLESLTTKYLVVTIVLILAITLGGFAYLLYFQIVDLDKLAKFVDAVFKAMAVLLGMIWTLNRYYVGRTDAPRLKVDADIKTIEYPQKLSSFALLIFRLDIINTGSILLESYQHFLEIESVVPSSKGVTYEKLYRFPETGTHSGSPIEPNSWAAINDAIPIPREVKAVRIFLNIVFAEGKHWTWHKTFDVSGVNDE